MNRAAIGLTVLGLAQMAGDVADVPALRGAAAAAAASPAPRVFSAVRGFETFSVGYELSWREGGARRAVALTSELNAKLPGPYNLRNVYGAALAYGPVLPASLREPVLRYALCGERPLLRRLGFAVGRVSDPVRIEYRPRGRVPEGLPLRFEADCG